MEEGIRLPGSIRLPEAVWKAFDCKEQDIRSFSPLTFAYIGDCVYELMIRTVVVERGNKSPQKLPHELRLSARDRPRTAPAQVSRSFVLLGIMVLSSVCFPLSV